MKIVLAYSGGLDTSVLLSWIKEKYNAEMIAFCANIGQEDELTGLAAKAKKTGASKIYIDDLQEEFARDFIYPMLRAGAIYEGQYLLGTSIARPLIAKRMVEIAKNEKADAIAHGATGKGNDQVRFELTAAALAPDLKVIAPWRDERYRSEFPGRQEMIDYCAKHKIPVQASAKKPYSMDRNLLHISYEAGILEDPWYDSYDLKNREYFTTLSVLPEDAPDKAEFVELGFYKGDCVSVKCDGIEQMLEKMNAPEHAYNSAGHAGLSPFWVMKILNKVGGKHGVGRVDMVENRFVGMKSRGVYETPGGAILHFAHRQMESLTMDREVMHQRDALIPKYAALVYNGFWYAPERYALQAYVEESQKNVTGTVRVKLYKGNIMVTGRKSPMSLYNPHIATMEADPTKAYNQDDATGFIRLNGLRLKVAAKVRGTKSSIWMSFIRSAIVLAIIALVVSASPAESKLAAIFGDNMVLQQQKPLPIWGWCEPDDEVAVTFAGQKQSTHADANGQWVVRLSGLKASAEPQSLVIETGVASGQKEVLTNILIGEVWLASGQSNMEKPIGKQTGQKPTFNAEAELAAANYPNIRIFKVEKTLAAAPEKDLTKFNGWQECSSNTLDSISFSAAAYFFGREIHTNLNVPVGLVESSWGGTRIEPWTPPEGFRQISELAKFAVPDTGTNKIPNTRPMVIYNAMIAPIVGFAMRGALWYQGESNLAGTNADNDYQNYDAKMAALVGGWRKIWGEGIFPFYFVQIAPFKYTGGKKPRVNSPEMLPEFWTIQLRAARHIKNAGIVITTDIVDNLDDIHPRDKASVGHRLALLALNGTYHRDVVSSGPVFREAKFGDGKADLKFDHVDGGLMSKDGQPLTWFTIAGADGKFVQGEAKIVGDMVEISSTDVKEPHAVRFAWAETAQPNLVNGAGLPAEPFRTDEAGN